MKRTGRGFRFVRFPSPEVSCFFCEIREGLRTKWTQVIAGRSDEQRTETKKKKNHNNNQSNSQRFRRGYRTGDRIWLMEKFIIFIKSTMPLRRYLLYYYHSYFIIMY